MLQQHVLTNSKQEEYHMSKNADAFTEMIKIQNRRDLGPAVMAIPVFMGNKAEKCLDWINSQEYLHPVRMPTMTGTDEQI